MLDKQRIVRRFSQDGTNLRDERRLSGAINTEDSQKHPAGAKEPSYLRPLKTNAATNHPQRISSQRMADYPPSEIRATASHIHTGDFLHDQPAEQSDASRSGGLQSAAHNFPTVLSGLFCRRQVPGGKATVVKCVLHYTQDRCQSVRQNGDTVVGSKYSRIDIANDRCALEEQSNVNVHTKSPPIPKGGDGRTQDVDLKETCGGRMTHRHSPHFFDGLVNNLPDRVLTLPSDEKIEVTCADTVR